WSYESYKSHLEGERDDQFIRGLGRGSTSIHDLRHVRRGQAGGRNLRAVEAAGGGGRNTGRRSHRAERPGPGRAERIDGSAFGDRRDLSALSGWVGDEAGRHLSRGRARAAGRGS